MPNQQAEAMVRLIAPKRATGMSLNMRNSTMTERAMATLNQTLRDPKFYLVGLDLRFCYLNFDDILKLANGIKINTTLVKLDLSSNALVQCYAKFLLEELIDNTCLADLRLANNLLDDEFAVDLALLLEQNQILHTIDLSNNPISEDGGKYLLQSLLQYNDTIESLGDLDKNEFMGVRTREDIK